MNIALATALRLLGSVAPKFRRLARFANAKGGIDFSALVNALLRKDIELIETAK